MIRGVIQRPIAITLPSPLGVEGSLSPPLAPTISGAVTIGGTLTGSARASGVTSKWQVGATFDGGGAWSDIAGQTGQDLVVAGAQIGCSISRIDFNAAAPLGVRSNVLIYAPLTDYARLLDLLDPRTLSDGAVAAWADQKRVGFSAAQGNASKKPTRSATSLNGTPGVSFDTDDAFTGSTTIDLSGISGKATLTFAAIDTTTALSIVTQAIPSGNITTQPGIQAGVNVASAGRLSGSAHGTGGAGAYGSADCAEGLAAAKVISIGYDCSVAGGIAFIRVNGVAQSLTVTVALAAAGNFSAASILTIGAFLGEVSFNWTGVMGFWSLSSGVLTDSSLTTFEQYVATATGLGVL